MSSSVYIDNKGKHVLMFREELTQGLNGTTSTTEAKYSINFSRPNRKFCFSLHYNASNSFLFVNTTKTHQFKGNNYELKNIPCF